MLNVVEFDDQKVIRAVIEDASEEEEFYIDFDFSRKQYYMVHLRLLYKRLTKAEQQPDELKDIAFDSSRAIVNILSIKFGYPKAVSRVPDVIKMNYISWFSANIRDVLEFIKSNFDLKLNAADKEMVKNTFSFIATDYYFNIKRKQKEERQQKIIEKKNKENPIIKEAYSIINNMDSK